MNGNDPDIKKFGGDAEDADLFRRIKRLIRFLMLEKKASHSRVLSTADYFIDRWERSEFLGFGEGSSIYDSTLVLGDVRVGKETWIGPYTILDGSGGELEIGDHCNISAGVHIYTHDTVDCVITDGPLRKGPVKIGNHVYIGPHSIIVRGVTLGDYVVIGANSLVTRDIPGGSKAYGTPARVTGPSGQDTSEL